MRSSSGDGIVADEPTRHRADVGPAVAADLGLVVDSAERDPHEPARHRARDRLPERGLPDARRPDEAQDRLLPRLVLGRPRRRAGVGRVCRIGGARARPRGLALLAELADREVVDEAVLHLLEVVVILVQGAVGGGEVDGAAGDLSPRERHDPIEPRPHHAALGRNGRHRLEARELAFDLGADLGRQRQRLDALPELLHLRGPRVVVAELALDGAELLAQHVVPLRLRELLGRLAGDLVHHLLHHELVLQQVDEPPQQRERRLRREQLLARLRRERRRRGRQPAERARILGPVRRRAEVVGQLRRERDDLSVEVLRGARQRLGLGAGRLDERRSGDPRDEVGVGLHERVQPDAIDPLEHEADRAIGSPVQLVNDGGAADPVEVVGLGVRCLAGPHRRDGDLPVRAHRVVDEADLAGVGDGERRHGGREQHALAERQDAERRREIPLPLRAHEDLAFGSRTRSRPRS
jgi:hypothetical protein